MNTFLGACVGFGVADLDEAMIARSQVVYLEGYLFDPPEAQAAFRRAAALARAAGRQVAITLSDAFCVGRHRAAFLDFIRKDTDILFANEAEITALYETDSFEDAAFQAAGDVAIAALTRSEKGSVILAEGSRILVPAAPSKVVDTTGAGDAYAAGFLAAHTRGLGLAEAGRWGSIAAAEVIGHYGARPQADLKGLVA
jgi:fructokinase